MRSNPSSEKVVSTLTNLPEERLSESIAAESDRCTGTANSATYPSFGEAQIEGVHEQQRDYRDDRHLARHRRMPCQRQRRLSHTRIHPGRRTQLPIPRKPLAL